MSYRPNYSSDWRPPPRHGDSCRYYAEQRCSTPNKRQTDTRVRDGGGFWLHDERPMLLEREDSRRLHRHKERTLTQGEEHLDPPGGGSTSRNASYRRPRPRTREANLPSKSATLTSVRAYSSLGPSVQASQHGGIREDTFSNCVVPGPPKLTSSSTTAGCRNSSSNLDALDQGTASSHSYSLRSRQLNASSQRNLPSDSIRLDPIDASQMLTSTQNLHGAAGISDSLQQKGKYKRITPQRVEPPPVPTATGLYLAQARLPTVRCAAPKKLLVILDLNGTLLARPNRAQSHVLNIRPGVHQLLDYLFHNHVIMFYSSARPANVEAMVDTLVSKKHAKSLAAVWGRDHLELTSAQYNEKVQVYKKLEKVWADQQIQNTCLDGQRWSQANTVLVDDSHLKALSQPHNLIQVPEFTKKTALTKAEQRREREIVASLGAKLEELKWAHDVSRQIFCWQTGLSDPPRASKLSPLPKKEISKTGDERSDALPADGDDDSVDSDGGVMVANNDRVDNVQVVLEENMEKLTTDPPRVKGDSNCMNEPAISAEEWKEFLK